MNEEYLVTEQRKEAEFLLAQAQFTMHLGYRIPLPHTHSKCMIKFSPRNSHDFKSSMSLTKIESKLKLIRFKYLL